MTQQVIGYIFIAVIGILAIFSFAIGIEKMIKIIMGNYILSSIARASSSAITLLINYINANPDTSFFGMGSATLANFFTNGKTTIILILYILLIVLVYKKSKIHISLPMDDASRKMTQIIFVPLTVISIALTLQVTLMGMDVANIQSLSRLSTAISTNPYVIMYFSLTPVWILLHGIITVFLTSEMKVSAQSSLPPL
ncbi:MAG: hypothetical protein NTX91_02635 [candidate division SR1 bacterium]|nr:hypothetical protein [candidate division SR1 bacterium]